MLPRRRLVAGSALVMAMLLVIQLAVSGSAALGTAIFCLVGFAAGVRTPASSGLGLEQLPDHPGAMMAARTAATPGLSPGSGHRWRRDCRCGFWRPRRRAGGRNGRLGGASCELTIR